MAKQVSLKTDLQETQSGELTSAAENKYFPAPESDDGKSIQEIFYHLL